ncbi:MAG: hypothetical protein IPG66_16360 [Hydrogenophilales bacterium]|nr:hypothetical protein [Hydrogenophilales bacterium]
MSNCQIEWKTRDIQSPPSLLGAAYYTSNLSELGVPAGELDAYNNVVLNRLQHLRKVKGLEASDDELYPLDLEISHQAMHYRLDSLIAGLSLSAKGPSVLIGIPVTGFT